MASAVPQWLFGKNCLLSVKALTINATTGVITTGTAAVSFFGVLNGGNPYGVQNSVTKVDVSPSDNPYQNKAIVEQGSSMTITEILQASASTAIGSTDSNTGIVKNAIEKLVLTTFHYQVTASWFPVGGSAVHTNVGNWQYSGHGETYSKTGQSQMTMNLETFSSIASGTYDLPITIT